MKRQLFTLILALGISFVLNAGQTHAQRSGGIRADIPFAFSANNKELPAGTYRINSANDSGSIWRLQNTSARAGRYLLSGSLDGRPDQGTLRLTFHRYGDRHFLVSFKTPTYEVALPRSKTERMLLAAQNTLPTRDIVIETVAARSF